MSKGVMEKIINFLRIHNGLILDITGGCPELHPNLKYLVEEAYKTVSRLMIRTNLTILLERDVYWISEFYRDHEVVIIASLPCYTKENVDKQRGNGAFEKSIKALKKLNELGYGDSLELNLVYNPGGNFLPNSQMELEKDYRKHLFEKYGIKFNNLFTITNVPLGRFKNYLKSNGLIKEYIKLLVDNFNPDAVPNIMCRTLISVDWQGVLYNCDFNLSAGLPINISGKIYNIDDIQEVIQKRYEIILTEHCYACTAGSGSSCSGALVE
jgi:radical SAM/Cys-rich protein